MIRRTELLEAGRFNKPHGVKGEISATLTLDADLGAVRCIVVEIDGIFVPFFVNAVRPKTADTSLVTIDGIESDDAACGFVNRTFYLLRDDPAIADESEGDDDGMYASDLIGYEVIDAAHGSLGRIEDVNDSTANILFVVRTPADEELLIPVAEEFIEAIDPEAEVVNISIPDEILTLNSRSK